MMATYRSGVHKYAIFVVAWAVVLLTAGALVTSEDAALAVPDWPLSYGTLNPPMVGGIAFEHSHRLIAAGLGLLIIALAVLLRKDERPWMKHLGYAAVAGVIFQGVLGGLTVLKLLHYWLPVMHACTAEIMFAILVSIAVFTSRWYLQNLPQYVDHSSPSIHSIVTLNAFVIFMQVLVGAGFRHKYLSLKPHVLYGAPIALAMVIYTAYVLKRRFPEVVAIRRMGNLLYSLVGVQVVLGLLALWARITSADDPQPLPPVVISTVVHTVVGAVLFATAIATVIVCYRLVPRKREVLFATTKGEVPA